MSSEPSSRRVCLGAGAAALVVLAGCLAPWLRVTLPGGTTVLQGTEVLPLAGPVVLAALCLAVAIAVHAATGDAEWRRLAVGAGCAVALIAGLQIATIETVSALIPHGLLPASIRRVTVDLRAGAGLWLAFGGAVGAVAILLGAARVTRLASRLGPSRPVVRWRVFAGLTALICAAVAFGVLRYQPWLSAAAAGQEYHLQAWELPWVGPGSLVPIWLLVASVVSAVLGSLELGALLAVLAGWLMNVSAAVAIAAHRAIGEHRLDDLVPDAGQAYVPAFHLTTQSWAVFVLGLLVAGAGAALVAPRDQ